MNITSWGKYPHIDATINYLQFKSQTITLQPHTIARGLGRSYGDSALSAHIIDCHKLDYFQSFDSDTGILTCNAGVSLEAILQYFVPKGWFLPVTPGTKFVTVGGAIASDVHGKNHHLSGCFSDHVQSFELLTVNSGILKCSRSNYSNLFYATCGGMGLTGIILSVSFRLLPIKSAYIKQKTIKSNNLKQLLSLFETNKHYTYSVAWIDCSATGESLGRSLLILGEHADTGPLTPHQKSKLTIPINFPSRLLNPHTIKIFNALYFRRVRHQETTATVHYDSFFYPLDSIRNWNNIYGKNGFTQYQFVIPKSAGLNGLTEILTTVSNSKQNSLLAVLKLFGKKNANYLSFPIEGYTLALDFKLTPKVLALLDELDAIVTKLNGRLYLSKDVRMSEKMFKAGYPQWTSFQAIRQHYQADKVFQSLQSLRIGL
ncbi:FAD-linked oxidase [Photobacterium kishitanii]|uniref:FAD-binding oxidoreductase n=1 Tax=Photobacterium kishitanii TaxID=318456 RepID=A0AAX0YV67_9GAMM|nr:FAD-binding oxidoreductase [Photobacterium kishitanii]KJG09157.1 FAD-linked oxidase [Photobacterium kishitanii]KJG56371.1 FAD-linked oxidase [Photobacterium kishitanii]KJG60235.1 FAD-linked oxidase [Photobacterium kishitanii]KJG64490.1 FAD-linked oxidase [Photobacterium kishitanii]KJG68674.1 FAD-linked oxidase [Photobacterium kishitanii]